MGWPAPARPIARRHRGIPATGGATYQFLTIAQLIMTAIAKAAIGVSSRPDTVLASPLLEGSPKRLIEGWRL